MCDSNGDIEDFSPVTPYKVKMLKKSYSKCKKCDEKPVLLLQKKDPFCKSCFFEYCNHKYRSTIGKTKKVKHGDKVLLACSGGRKSTAMLHLTKQALDSASAKQISFTPEIIFIDETVLSPFFSEKIENRSKDIVCQLEEYGYPVIVSHLEMVCKMKTDEFYWTSNTWKSSSQSPCLEAEEWFQTCLTDMSLSERCELIKHLRLLLMTEIARKMNFNYLFVGDSGNSLAVNLLTDICLGRGSQISSDTNFYDNRYSVPICRPIREFLNKEIMHYNHMHNCSYIVVPDMTTKANPTSCIQKLTECFITELQEQFPATVFTIFRTGGKLSLDSSMLAEESCSICQSKLDNMNSAPCSASEALKISQKVSTTDSHKVENGVISFEELSTELQNLNFASVCYGCSALFRNKLLKGSLNISDFCERLKRSSETEQISMKSAVDSK